MRKPRGGVHGRMAKEASEPSEVLSNEPQASCRNSRSGKFPRRPRCFSTRYSSRSLFLCRPRSLSFSCLSSTRLTRNRAIPVTRTDIPALRFLLPCAVLSRFSSLLFRLVSFSLSLSLSLSLSRLSDENAKKQIRWTLLASGSPTGDYASYRLSRVPSPG